MPPTARLASFTVGDWLAEPRTCRLRRLERVCRLRPQLVDLLVCLAKRPGELVLKEEILAEVWPGQHIAACGLSRCVAELRRALDDDARQPCYIEATRKRGYRLIAPVVWLEPALAAARSADEPRATGSCQTDARERSDGPRVGRHLRRIGRWVGLWAFVLVVAGTILVLTR
jgi:DNA-binding winged helix-turn-helix (wHTH) protein